MATRTQPDTRAELKNSDVICKVQCTLDYLKYCADHKNPTGEGIPVDITIMPDFVVDVDGAAIHLFNKHGRTGGRIAAGEVGSRAGRVLSILAQLRDRDDEGYCLNYIAKTSPAGRAVLEERLQRHLIRRGIEPVKLPYLVPADYTRFATLGRSSYRNIASKNRHLVWPNAKSIVTASELSRHFYKPLRAVQDANALYLATDSMRQFEELLSTVVSGAEQEQDAGAAGGDGSPRKNRGFRFIIVDLAALHHVESPAPEEEDISGIPGVKQLRKAVDELIAKSTNEGSVASRTRLVVIVKEPEQRFKNPMKDVKRLYQEEINLRDLEDAVIVYRRPGSGRIPRGGSGLNNILWFDGRRYDEVSVDVDRGRPEARDAFVAGLVLHRAVASAWSTIPRKDRLHYTMQVGDDWTRGLIPDPYGNAGPSGYWQDLDEERDFLKDHWPFSEAVQMGAAMAGLWSQKPTGKVPDRRALLLASIEEENETVDVGLPGDLSRLVDEDPIGWYKRVTSIEARRLTEGKAIDKNDSFVTHLWWVVSKVDLPEHPAEWGDGNIAKAIRIASWGTVRTAIALRALRSLSRLLESGLGCFSINAAYLTDLDGTLLQSSGLRSLCLKNAFLPFVARKRQVAMINRSFPVLPNDPRDPNCLMKLLDACNELYHASVYKQARYWTAILDKYPYYSYGSCPKDFRQVWNHRLSYPAFLWTLTRWAFGDDDVSPPDLPRDIVLAALSSEKVKKLLGMTEKDRIARCEGDLKQWFGIEEDDGTLVVPEGKGDIDELFEQIASVETKYRRYFEEVADRFWNVHYEPLRHTRECLSTMRDVLGTRLYVATEGHHETQLKKIELLGLARFFPDMRVMSTEAAASTTDEDLRSIRHELQNAKGSRNAFGVASMAAQEWRPGNKFAEEFVTFMAGFSKKMESEISYLTLYEDQWRVFEAKKLRYIYPLIIASVIADPENPFVPMTDLRSLVHRIEYEAEKITKTYFAMVGDRERSDIKPIIDSCGKTPVQDGEPRIDRVITVRMLTLDHKDEDVYWPTQWDTDPKGSGPPVAHHVVWTPVQALHCLAREEVWGASLDYHTIPAIIPGRLIHRGDEKLNDHMFRALVWGRGQKTWALERSASLVSFLVLRSTIRDEGIDNLKFVEAAVKRLEDCRRRADWDAYEFAVDVMYHIVSETAYMPRSKLRGIPEKVRDTMCAECRAKLGGDDNPKRQVCIQKAKELLGNLANLDGHPQCPPPSETRRGWILKCEVDPAKHVKLERFIEDWKDKWADLHEQS